MPSARTSSTNFAAIAFTLDSVNRPSGVPPDFPDIFADSDEDVGLEGEEAELYQALLAEKLGARVAELRGGRNGRPAQFRNFDDLFDDLLDDDVLDRELDELFGDPPGAGRGPRGPRPPFARDPFAKDPFASKASASLRRLDAEFSDAALDADFDAFMKKGGF